MVGSKNIITPKVIFVAVTIFIIAFVGLRLREYSYSSVPLPGETNDEYSFGWLGISLLEEGVPKAWSGIDGYPNYDYQKINVDNIYDIHPDWPAFSINSPWFDHPPLFGLFIGGYSYLKGIRNFEDASVIILRRPMLKIGALSVILVFILSYLLFGYFAAVISSLIYAVSPLVVISSRLALAENGYIPIALSALIFSYLYITRRSKWLWLSACIVSAVAVLFKLSASYLSVSLLLTSFYFGKKDKKFMISGAVFSLLIPLVTFMLYGLFYDWNTFVNVLSSNSNRYFGVGAEIIYSAFFQTKITGAKYLTDGWVFVGWISAVVFSFRGMKKSDYTGLLILFFYSFILIFILFGSEAYGWYRYPVLPILFIMSGKIIFDLIKNSSYLFYLLMLIPFGTIVHRLIGVDGFQTYTHGFRMIILILFVLFVFPSKNNMLLSSIRKSVSVLVFLFVIYLSIKLIYFYNIDAWYFAT